ncbi:MAG: hypothetical protein KDA27_28640, partial [Candidatus Eisenbacteria bacterium]|nr:hypothetical protein [Candidatus Eisenbacteria bacterium]
MTSSWNYDYYNRFLLVLCEATGVNGAPEVYHRSWCSDPNGDWLSPDDGIPSYGASVSSFNSPISTCNSLGSSFAVLLYGWVEGEGGTGVTLSRRSDCRLDAVHDLPVSNPLATAIGAESGDVVQLWTENSDGTIQLRAREGSTPPCSIQRVDALTPALVGPAGWPPTRFRAYNNCTGVGIPDLPIEFILFDDPAIVLAADQSPWVSGETDDDGYAEFHIRGGGCLWQTVPVGPWEWCWADLEGIRSPDIDADCVVTESDRLYIEQRLGSYDFCADLDGSGLVDAGDLAVVDATMGDSCEDTSGIDAPVGSGPRLQLTVAPNPAQDQTILRIVQPNDGTGITAVRVLDAGGRQVKTIRVSSAGG